MMLRLGLRRGRGAAEEAAAAPRSMQDRPWVGQVWVRRCSRCWVEDLSAAFGGPGLLDHDWLWQCPTCAGFDWTPVQREFPAGAASLDRHPRVPDGRS